MRILLICVGIFLWSTHGLANEDPEQVWQHYLQAGWEEVANADGDLNGDDVDDHVFVIEAPKDVTLPSNTCSAESHSDAPVRRLIIALSDPGQDFILSADNETVLLRSDQGGMFGDPLSAVAIENGVLVIHHYGGSAWRWGETLRFRLENDAWLMTGMTITSSNLFHNYVSEYDYNALTNKIAITLDDNAFSEQGIVNDNPEPLCMPCLAGHNCPETEQCRAGKRSVESGTYWFNTPTRERVALAEFRCWHENIGLLKHAGFQ